MASDSAKRQMAYLLSVGRAELVGYRPGGGDARTIAGVVERGGLRRGHDEAQVLDGRAFVCRVTVLNDLDVGINSAPPVAATETTPAIAGLDVGSDLMDVAERIGGPAVTRAIRKPVQYEQDIDFFTVEVI